MQCRAGFGDGAHMNDCRGTLRIARGLLQHAVLDDGPFDRRSAWLWILSEAAWAPRQRSIGSVTVELTRSELAVSVRFLAKQWQWDVSKVRRFLERLETEGMID